MKIKGAIFDLDGTLLNSMEHWGAVAPEFLESRGLSTDDDTGKRFLEHGMASWYKWCVENLGLSEDLDTTKKWIYDTMESKYETLVTLKDGAKELLQRLTDSGVKICLATATDRPTVEKVLARLGIAKYFPKIFTCSESGSKRETKIYNTALEYLGTPKDETYIFEDAHYALKTAHEGGFKTVCVFDKNVYESKEEMRALCDVYLEAEDRYNIVIE
ncbi:MAG: HAD family phosphatase [Ruminococcaceae bacterium]|nr:HAD family phosphatase [Oscillospiraceae bacterium]